MAKKSKTYKNAASPASSEWASVGANVARTCEPADAPVTQLRSPVVQGGRVYFVRAGEAIKIGFTNKLAQRLMELQVGSAAELELLADIPGTREDERNIHLMFSLIHIRGEWFAAHRDLLQFINKMVGGPRGPISYKRLLSLRPEGLTYG